MPHTLKAVNGSARLLQALINNFGAENPVNVYLLGMFSEEVLSLLPAIPDGKPTDEEAKTFNRVAWACEVSERTRDALKEIVKTAVGKGGVPGTYEAALLIQSLGLDT